MPTPADHQTSAEDLLETATAPATARYATDADWLIIDAHAHLAQAAGTGSHYTDAEAALDAAAVASLPTLSKLRAARTALAHAVLAER